MTRLWHSSFLLLDAAHTGISCRASITFTRELCICNIDKIYEKALVAKEDRSVIRRARIKEDAGSSGQSHKDEIDLALIDPELISQYYSNKYSRLQKLERSSKRIYRFRHPNKKHPIN